MTTALTYVVLDELGRLLGAAQRAGPQPRGAGTGDVLAGLRVDPHLFGGDDILGELGQAPGVLLSGRGQAGISADLPQQVVLALAVPSQEEGSGEGVQIHDKVHHLERQVPANVVHW